MKRYLEKDVYESSIERINFSIENTERAYISFSGGKDSTVLFHIIETCIKKDMKIAVMYIDLEAQYNKTIEHIFSMFTKYKNNIEIYWICLPLSLRNAVSSFEPKWCCWDQTKKELWVRDYPKEINIINEKNNPFDFFIPGMEFEEFMILFGEWFSRGKKTANFVGIRSDESLDRFRTISSKTKEMLHNKKYTSKISENVYNVYPLYDWKTDDIWKFHDKNRDYQYNEIYDMMFKAGLKISEMRICQPYGDDQKKGLWLYHILEQKTWEKLVKRVSGANSGSLYIRENGNINGKNKIDKPENHTWRSYTYLLLQSLPKKLQEHYIEKFRKYLITWKNRDYYNGISDEAPLVLENKNLVPSWRLLTRVILRNDYWCRGIGMSQPKSRAYGKYLLLKGKIKMEDIK